MLQGRQRPHLSSVNEPEGAEAGQGSARCRRILPIYSIWAVFVLLTFIHIPFESVQFLSI